MNFTEDVAFALRAIVFEPRLILMDEPLSALDKRLREIMRIERRALHRRLGATMIYVTHDQREALTVSPSCALANGFRSIRRAACMTTRPMTSSPASSAKAPWCHCNAMPAMA